MKLFLFLSALALFSAGGVVLSQTMTSQCPDGWKGWQDFCYLMVNTSRVTWTEANNECYNRLGHLLRVETNDEYVFVKKLLLMYPSDSYWTALNDLAVNQYGQSNNTFMWNDDQFPGDVVLKHWDKEPDNTAFEDCVGVDVQGAASIEGCNNRHAFICEIQKSADELCPPYWTSLNFGSDICYYVSNATLWPQLLNWHDARKTCDSMAPFTNSPTRKGRLISITSQEVQTFLSSDLSLVYYGRQLFWTGLNDINNEGSLVWSDRVGTPFQPQFMKWRQEPNNLAGQEHCGVLQPGGVWGDRNCDDKNNYACRMALPDNPNLFNMGCGGWTRVGQKCVFVHNTPTMSWTDSQTYCQARGGDLFRIESRDDNLWLGIQAGDRLSDYAYWIGLRVMEESFVWSDGSAADTSLLTWDREPHSYGHNGELQSCGAMGYDGNFADMSCWRQKAGTICEAATSNSRCGTGWLGFNTSCYLIDTNFKTRGEAAGFCHDSSLNGNGRLFALNTQGEKDWLVSQIALKPNGMMFFWSDLKDMGLNEWHWSRAEDDDPVMTEQLVTWSYEPNNWKGQESCVQVNVNGMLNDANCASLTGFLCQKMAPMPSTTAPPQTAAPTANPGQTSTPRQPGNPRTPAQPTSNPGTPGQTSNPGQPTAAPGGQQGSSGESRIALSSTLLMLSFSMVGVILRWL